MILNQKGFTLIEALLALLITGTLSLISFPPLVKLYDGIKLNQAIALLQSDLNYIRQANMMPFQGGTYTLRIYHKENKYALRQNGTNQQLRTLPQGISFPSVSTTLTDLAFNNLGHIGGGQTLLIKSKYQEKKIVFSIGTGGIDIRDSNEPKGLYSD